MDYMCHVMFHTPSAILSFRITTLILCLVLCTVNSVFASEGVQRSQNRYRPGGLVV